MNEQNFSANKIDLAEYKNENPARVCYTIRPKTKERLSNAIKNNGVLNASMVVDLAVNMFLDDLENDHIKLVVSLNNSER